MQKFMSTAESQNTAKSFEKFVAVFSMILMVKESFDADYLANDYDHVGQPTQTEAAYVFFAGSSYEVFFQVLYYADGWTTNDERFAAEARFELLDDKSFAPSWSQPMFHYLRIVARTNHGNVELKPEHLLKFKRVNEGNQVPFRIDDEEWFELWTVEPRNARD